MEIPSAKEKYEEAKRNAKEIYSKIGRIWCPALNDCITFNRFGWHHLIQKGPAFRPKSEQKRRFTLLPHAIDIVQTSPVIHEAPNINGNLWIFIKSYNDTKITVVVRQMKNGQKHFLSVYGGKQKSAP